MDLTNQEWSEIERHVTPPIVRKLKALEKALKIELLACAMWASEKCTTEFGINIESWVNLHRDARKAWMDRAKKQYGRLATKG